VFYKPLLTYLTHRWCYE